ncbi:MAG: histidine kinase [Muribaculum sp.]|nr:histidine kinase [Muribaculum sp.]
MKKKILFLFLMLLLLLSVTLILIIAMNNPTGLTAKTFLINMLYNFPVFIAMGIVDYWLIRLISRKHNNGGIYMFAIMSAILLIPVLWGCIAYMIAIFCDYPFSIVRNVLPAMLCNSIITLFVAVYLYGQYEVEISRQLAQAENEKLKYQFEALKNQVNPHFLFNSLNVLASLTYESPELANRFVKKLSAVYRYLLTSAQNMTVNLSDEMKFVVTYLYLEQMRHGDSLKIEIKEIAGAATRQVIPVSVQMLIENAIKHNTATPERPLYITIEESEDGVTVTNNIQRRNNANKTGVGLRNLRMQYELQRQHIVITDDDRHFTVFLPYVMP